MTTKFIEFSVGNFLSFKDTNTLSMVSAKLKNRDRRLDASNTIDIEEGYSLLTSAAIYGANASGKSNIVMAMAFMKHFVTFSSNDPEIDDEIHTNNFKLSTETDNKPSFFQVILIINNMKYRYGFEVLKNRVMSEWLFYVPKIREVKLFIRDEKGIHISRIFKEGRGLESKTRDNVSFLSVVGQFNGTISMEVLSWFSRFRVISGLDDTAYKGFTLTKFEDEIYKKKIVDLVRRFDLGIEEIIKKKTSKNNTKIFFPKDIPLEIRKEALRRFEVDQIEINTIHNKFNEDGNPIGNVGFNLNNNESEGTQKLFFLTAPLIEVLTKGLILVVDELEARLHPLITRSIIELFNSPESNPHRAQIIFTTHDTNMLSNRIFRRDQIWFVEKDQKGASHLYSLAELKVRNDASFESDYIKGRYGAIPFLGNLEVVECDNEE
jgi:uncharacterized protein